MFSIRIAAVALAASAAVAASAGIASASPHPVTPSVPAMAFEVDNGSTWTLSDHAVTSTGTEAGYADAGVVVNLGPASSFNGVKVTGSKGLAVNIWIADGSQATTPGTHPLSSPANFDYGLGQPGGTWYMTGKPGAYNGQTLTDAQIRADFAGDDVLAWVGIDNAGTSATGAVLLVNGHLALTALILEAAKGKVTVTAEPVFGL